KSGAVVPTSSMKTSGQAAGSGISATIVTLSLFTGNDDPLLVFELVAKRLQQLVDAGQTLGRQSDEPPLVEESLRTRHQPLCGIEMTAHSPLHQRRPTRAQLRDPPPYLAEREVFAHGDSEKPLS